MHLRSLFPGSPLRCLHRRHFAEERWKQQLAQERRDGGEWLVSRKHNVERLLVAGKPTD